MSSSSDFTDGGRFPGGKKPGRAPEKSNFSHTCNLLSQYLKENGSFGDLCLGITRSFDGNGTGVPPETHRQTATTATTMNLFPLGARMGANSSEISSSSKPSLAPRAAKKLEPERAPMTIFYAGQVVVCNDMPADKAKEIILSAYKESIASRPSTSIQRPKDSTNLTITPNLGNNLVPERPSSQRIIPDLSMARKSSLTRFLEKRKDRLTARAPYAMSKPTASPPDPTDAKSWLGLAA